MITLSMTVSNAICIFIVYIGLGILAYIAFSAIQGDYDKESSDGLFIILMIGSIIASIVTIIGKS